MRVDKFANRNVDDGLVEDDHLGVFVNVKALLRLWNITHCMQEPPVRRKKLLQTLGPKILLKSCKF